jgi:hypothetical protein
MVPAPTASDVPKKERRLTERFGGLGFDVDVVTNDAVDLSIGFMASRSERFATGIYCTLVRCFSNTYVMNASPSFGVDSVNQLNGVRKLTDSIANAQTAANIEPISLAGYHGLH